MIRMIIFLGHSYPTKIWIVIPTEAKRRDLLLTHPASNTNGSVALPFVIPSEAEGSAFRGPFLEMFFEEAAGALRPVGPTAKRQPSPAGLGHRSQHCPSTVGAAHSTSTCISTLSKKTFPGRACSSLFPLQYSKCDMQLSSAAPETALFLCDENIGRKFEPGTQFAHLAQGELPLVGQEHRNRALRSELRDQIALCKSLLLNQETHH